MFTMNNQALKGVVYAIGSFVGAAAVSFVILLGLEAADVSLSIMFVGLEFDLLSAVVFFATLYFVSRMSFTSKYVKGIKDNGLTIALLFVIVVVIVIELMTYESVVTNQSGAISLVVTLAIFFAFSKLHLANIR